MIAGQTYEYRVYAGRSNIAEGSLMYEKGV